MSPQFRRPAVQTLRRVLPYGGVVDTEDLAKRAALKSVRVPIRNPDPFQQVGVFAVPRSRCGDRVDRHLLKVFEWDATL